MTSCSCGPAYSRVVTIPVAPGAIGASGTIMPAEKPAVELAHVELALDLAVDSRQPRVDKIVLDHPDPAVVGFRDERRLARVLRELVDLAELDLLEFVGLAVDDRAGVGDRRPRALRQRGLGVARQLEIRERRTRARCSWLVFFT